MVLETTVSFSAKDYTLPKVFLPAHVPAGGVLVRPPIFAKYDVAVSSAAAFPPLHVRGHGAQPDGPDDDDQQTERETEGAFERPSLVKYIQVELLGGLLKGSAFRALVLVVITMNSVLVGLQTNMELEHSHAALFPVLDNIFLTFFAIEILLKWFADFAGFWYVGWNVFDFLIVTISLAGQGLSFMSTGRVLRILRVLRAFRTIKSIRMVHGLQMIVHTVFRSLPDMGNIFLLLGIVMFIFAVAGDTSALFIAVSS
jgi:hypothetical protein